jgi:hypothetical protein
MFQAVLAINIVKNYNIIIEKEEIRNKFLVIGYYN